MLGGAHTKHKFQLELGITWASSKQEITEKRSISEDECGKIETLNILFTPLLLSEDI